MNKILRAFYWLIVFEFIILLVSIATVYHFKSGSAVSGPTKCALVFGSVVHGNNDAGPGIRRRVEKAVELYAAKQIKLLIMSGGIGRAGQASEGEVMKQFAVSNGIPTEDIIVENGATSTWQNIRNSRVILEQQNCTNTIAISDQYHLARIEFSAILQGAAALHLVPANPPPKLSFEFLNTMREVLALQYYVLWHGLLHNE